MTKTIKGMTTKTFESKEKKNLNRKSKPFFDT